MVLQTIPALHLGRTLNLGKAWESNPYHSLHMAACLPLHQLHHLSAGTDLNADAFGPHPDKCFHKQFVGAVIPCLEDRRVYPYTTRALYLVDKSGVEPLRPRLQRGALPLELLVLIFSLRKKNGSNGEVITRHREQSLAAFFRHCSRHSTTELFFLYKTLLSLPFGKESWGLLTYNFGYLAGTYSAASFAYSKADSAFHSYRVL
jgi:hypothetical protein